MPVISRGGVKKIIGSSDDELHSSIGARAEAQAPRIVRLVR